MRLLALATDAFGAPGGIAQYNRDLFGALAGCRLIDVVDILPRHGVPPRDLPEKVRQRAAINGKLAYIIAAFQWARTQRPDLIFCGHINLLPLAHRLARSTGAPVWLQLHGIDAWERPERIHPRHFQHVALVTCVSRYTRGRFLSWAQVPPNRVKVLSNTVAEPGPEVGVAALRASLQLDGKRVLLTVGRLAASEAYKGQDRVIHCLPGLLQRHPELVYVIAGDGDDRPRLERLAEESGVADKVLFLGKVSGEDLDALYRIADLFVMPSTGEGFGIVFLEAMARGTPALGLDVDGSTDPLQDGELGRVSSESGLCEAIEQGLQAPPSPDLAARVQQTFGQANFRQQVQRLMQLLGESSSAVCH